MSEGAKLEFGLMFTSDFVLKPGVVLDTESNYIFGNFHWLCFEIHFSWRRR